MRGEVLYYLDHGHDDWPAQMRFCHILDINASQAEGEGEAFNIAKAALSYAKHKPLRLYRLICALCEYYRCKMNMAVLYREAETIKSDKNAGLMDRIIQNAKDDFVRSSPRDWPEILGLIAQKIMHLKYHEELMAGKYERSEKAQEADDDAEDC